MPWGEIIAHRSGFKVQNVGPLDTNAVLPQEFYCSDTLDLMGVAGGKRGTLTLTLSLKRERGNVPHLLSPLAGRGFEW
jgi:hypothetical protein